MDMNEPPEQLTEAAPATAREEPPEFDPSRMIGIVKRKAMIKDLAAAYQAECLVYSKRLLQLQRKWEEQQDYIERRTLEESRRQSVRPSKRQKKHF